MKITIKSPAIQFLASLYIVIGATSMIHAQTVNIKIDASKPGPKLNKNMWGIFFEDINFAADGGLHAELVKNRSFEFTDPMAAWKLSEPGSLTIQTEKPIYAANTHYARLTMKPGHSLTNEGFRGMGFRAGALYDFRIFARHDASPRISGLKVELISHSGSTLGSATIGGFSEGWELHRVRIRCNVTDPQGALRISAVGSGQLDVDMVSLYPVRTWKERPQGLRADLVQRLADLKPGFVRFPGGCIVEGRYLSTRYQWKKTVGPQEGRELIINRWNNEFRHKPAPDYFQSFGLGFMEYFQVCEDIGAEPLPVLNCGMACQFNSKELAPLSELDPFVQDALDLIEFANGSVDTEWGSKRAAWGHPKPFNMKMLGVGNEQWGADYFPRYERFATAIKAKYPHIQLVTSAGPFPSGPDFNLAWDRLKGMKTGLVDIIDEHVYSQPKWFFDNTHRYDGYDRKGPKVFMGEYAAQSVAIASPDNKNNWICALSEAAFMIGLERNGDVVHMSSYAPLFAHLDAWQWTPNLIWFDNLNSFATPNYYVQQQFMLSSGGSILNASVTDGSGTAVDHRAFYVSAALSENGKEVILKVVNASQSDVECDIAVPGVREWDPVKVTVLKASPNAVNSIDQPKNVAPVEISVTTSKGILKHRFPGLSFVVLRIGVH